MGGNAAGGSKSSQDPLGQTGEDGRLGETFIPAGGVFADPGVIVTLFEKADRSTPFHEFGHVFLEVMGTIRRRRKSEFATG